MTPADGLALWAGELLHKATSSLRVACVRYLTYTHTCSRATARQPGVQIWFTMLRSKFVNWLGGRCSNIGSFHLRYFLIYQLRERGIVIGVRVIALAPYGREIEREQRRDRMPVLAPRAASADCMYGSV